MRHVADSRQNLLCRVVALLFVLEGKISEEMNFGAIKMKTKRWHILWACRCERLGLPSVESEFEAIATINEEQEAKKPENVAVISFVNR